MGNRKYSDELKDEIIKEYLSGKSSLQLEKEYGINRSYITQFLNKKGVKLRSNKINSLRYSCNDSYFEKIDTPEKAYWLGFIYADGYIGTSRNNNVYFGMSLASKDIEVLYKLKEDLDSNHPIPTYKTSGGYNSETVYSRIIVTSEKIANDLISHGVYKHKTNILNAPDIDKKLTAHFIRGYMDGDGCITSSLSQSGKKQEFTVKILGTDNLLDYIKEFIENNQIATINHYYKRKIDQTVSSIELGGNNQVFSFLSLIYQDAPFCLSRKYNKFLELKKQINKSSF